MKKWNRAWIGLAALIAVGALGLTGFSGTTEDAKSVNDKCPMSGKAVNEDCTSTVTVNLCCGGCVKKFGKDPVSVINKVDKLPNENCPLKGKKANGSKSGSAVVAFCCGDCKKKFDKEPAKFLSKITARPKKKK